MWRILPCVVTGDLRASRRAPDRGELQNRLRTAIDRANAQFRDQLLAPFQITLGDEWQGLLVDASAAYRVAAFFRDALAPQGITVGVGEGELATDLVTDVRQMDGEAFHRSRTALEEAKRRGVAVAFRMRDPSVDPLLSGIASLIFDLYERWTPVQRERYCLLRELGTMAEVARRLSVSVAAVSQSLSSARAARVQECEDALSEFLSAWSRGAMFSLLVKR
ncbi:MAG: SatD family protein [candidate division KSB1 bacterium]|nr:SatD family protein [candidate division KSB1 bacterium]